MEALEDEDSEVRMTAVCKVRDLAWTLEDPIETQALPVLRRLAERGKDEPTRSIVLDLIEAIETET